MKPSSTVDTLVRARALIEDESNWVTGNYAVDHDGFPVDPQSFRASRWCALGALKRIDGEFETTAKRVLNNVIAHDFDMGGIIELNDARKEGVNNHDRVLEAFDKAIERARL